MWTQPSPRTQIDNNETNQDMSMRRLYMFVTAFVSICYDRNLNFNSM